MWDIKTILKDLYYAESFQEFINRRFKDDSKVILSKNAIKTISTNYASFYLDDMAHTIGEVSDYSLDDMRQTDIVLDIGACIGAFSLKVCKNVKWVYAIEPVMTDQIKKNVQLNNIKNITVFDFALGDKGEVNLNWAGHVKKANALSLSEIIKLCGGRVDFLKSDCEGGEWYIKPNELQGIRRVEIEVHRYNKNHDFKNLKNMLVKAGFNYTTTKLSKKTIIIHAKREYTE